MKIAPGIHRVGGNSMINAYLVEQAGEVTIIDAGLPGYYGDIDRELGHRRCPRRSLKVLFVLFRRGGRWVGVVGMRGERAGVPAGLDVWERCRELIPAGSVFAFLAEHREALFPAGMFADMYPSPNGRPGLPPQVLAVTVMLQALHGLPDFETVQALRCDLRWKAACGLGLLDAAFDASLLTCFRRRLVRSDDPGRLLPGPGRW